MRNIQILTEREATESYDEMLDDCYPEVSVCCYTFSASDVLRTMDPIAYNEGFSEYVYNMAEDEVFLVEGYTDHLRMDEDEEEEEDEDYLDSDAHLEGVE